MADPEIELVVPAKKSFVARLAGAVSSHAYLSLAVIVVLLILVIWLCIYYRGFLFLGPYVHAPPKTKKRKFTAAADEASVPIDVDEKGDPETERLIDNINSK